MFGSAPLATGRQFDLLRNLEGLATAGVMQTL